MVRALDYFCDVCETDRARGFFAVAKRLLVEYYPVNSGLVCRGF